MPPPPFTRGTSKESAFLDIERVPFYGTRVPPVITAMKKSASKLERATLQKLIRLAVSSTEGKQLRPEMFDSFATPDVPVDIIHVVYAGVLKLIQAAFRCSITSLPADNFAADLKAINFNTELVTDLSSAIYGSRRAVLEGAIAKNVPKNVSITDFKWKVNVAISTTSLNRVLEPSVSVNMALSNGETKCFEMSVAKFQELRYNVAAVMKEMEDLEKRSILKIQD